VLLLLALPARQGDAGPAELSERWMQALFASDAHRRV
jgi:hypothetical protein